MYDTSPKGTGTRQGRYVSSQLLPPTCRLRLQSMPMEWYGPKPSGNQACKYHRPVDPGISSIQGASHRPIYICRCMYEYAPMYEERTVGSTRPMYPDIVGIRNYSCSRYSTSEKLHWHTCFVKIANSAPFTGGYVRLAATRAFVFELRAFFRRENIRELGGRFLRTPHAKICYDCRAIFFQTPSAMLLKRTFVATKNLSVLLWISAQIFARLEHITYHRFPLHDLQIPDLHNTTGNV